MKPTDPLILSGESIWDAEMREVMAEASKAVPGGEFTVFQTGTTYKNGIEFQAAGKTWVARLRPSGDYLVQKKSQIPADTEVEFT